MAQWLKQSTVFVFRIGPFVDSTDAVTPETGLSIGQSDMQISKAGGAFAQTSDASPTTTHDSDGWYQCPLTATDTGTLGTMEIQIAMSGALPVWRHFVVVPAEVYDSLIAGSDTLHADVTQWLGTAAATPDTAGVPHVNTVALGNTTQTARDLGAGVKLGNESHGGSSAVLTLDHVVVSSSTADGISVSTTGANDAVSLNASSAVSRGLAVVNTLGIGAVFQSNASAGMLLLGNGTNATGLRINASNGTTEAVTITGTVDVDSAITATSITYTGNLTAGNITTAGTMQAGTNGLPWASAWDAEVQSEVADALAVYDPPTNAEMEARTLLAASYFDAGNDPVATVTNVTNSGNATLGNNTHDGNFASVTDVSAAVTSLATDSVNAAALAADAVSEIQSGLATAASIGALNDFDAAADTVANVTTVSNSGNATLGNVAHGGTGATLTLASMTASGNITAGNIAATHVGETTGNVSGSVGSVTGAVGSVTGNVGGSVEGNVDGSVASVTAGVALGNVAHGGTAATLTAASVTVSGNVTAGNLATKHVGDTTGNTTGSLSGSVGSVTGAVGSVAGNVDGSTASVTGTVGGVAGTITTLDALDTAQDTQHGTTQTAVAALPTLAQILAGGDVDGYTLEQTLKVCMAALGGKLSGAATTTITIRAADDSKARITATVDADGNRSAVTLDAAG